MRWPGGYHLGFVAGSDSIRWEHGVEGGIMAAFVPALTSENVWERHLSAVHLRTSGARILASMTIGTHHMGEEVLIGPNCR